MATFTMNSQKNFTQATPAKGIFDKAFFFSIVLIAVVGGIWGIERILIYTTDRQITDYQNQTAASLASVDAADVQAVHDVTSRLATLGESNTRAVNAPEILSALERSTIPQVKLTQYEYKNDGSVAMSGVTSDYRFLAEQILRYRQEEIFKNAEVGNTGRNEAGQVTFDIRAEAPEAAAPTATPLAL